MRISSIKRKVLATLTDEERELLLLLMKEDVKKDDVLLFLEHYDIDGNTAEATFLINELLDRVGIGATESPPVPRVRGLAEYFRFQNATALMHIPANEPVVDSDLVLKIRYPDRIRPFTPSKPFMSGKGFAGLTGRRYARKILKALRPVTLHGREYLIPDDRYLPDVLFWRMYLAFRYNRNKDSTLCYLYDMHRYCGNTKPSAGLSLSLAKRETRRRLGRIKRWLLMSKR